MLPKKVTEEFLNRPSESWSWLKKVPIEELLEEIRSVCNGFKFKTKPFKHQLVSFLIGIYNPAFLFFLDMGLGKTKIVLDLLSYYKKKGLVNKVLVVAPTSVVGTWVGGEIEKHSNLKGIDLLGSKRERLDKLEEEADVYVINFQGLQALMTEVRRGKRVPITEFVRRVTSKFDAIIVDESHFIKNKKSLTFKLVNEISKYCKVRYCLSGTPMARDPADLWSQFYIIDRGEALGQNFTFFREVFFTSKMNFWGGADWKFNEKLKLPFHKKISNKSIRYKETEANDLPERFYQRVALPISKEASPYYSQCIEGLVKIHKDDADWMTEIGNVFVRLRMITSGFLEFVTPETGEKQSFIFDENPKLEALKELLESTDGKFVVFHDYIKTGEIISNMLVSEKIKHVRLYGGTKDKREPIDTFVSNPNCRVLLANSQSGGFGLNLQVARYVVFFESPVSPIVRKQAEKRVHRTGQTKTVWIYDLVIKKSIDEKILDYLSKGEDLFRAIVEGKTLF